MPHSNNKINDSSESIGLSLKSMRDMARQSSLNYDKAEGWEKAKGGFLSGFHMMDEAYRNGSIESAFNKVYREGGVGTGKIKAGKLALGAIGTMGVLRGTLGAVRGALTDNQGNVDLPGIPFF